MLLQTKLHVPVTRGELVPRPLLLGRLNGGMSGRLTLVAAPAGFGKTTLIARWGRQLVERNERAVAWFSLDEGDNDLVTFFTYFIAALQNVDDRLGLAALELLQSPQIDNVHIILTALVNDMAAAGRGIVLVLDDYHLISSQAIHEAVSFLLESAPAGFHLVLLSRADPPFSLARFRARHQITEIRQSDLRFTNEEAGRFLQQLMALDLSEDAIRILGKRTEGWIAGLQMAALSLQGRVDADRFIAEFAGSHRYIFDYLAEEALAYRPAGTRTFLLHTALLERMCGPLCDAVLESDGSQQILEQLESANLFVIPLDDTRRWYRYHHLFSDLLRHHLRREDPALIPELHLRASRWHEDAGFLDEALHHALEAEAFERAAALVAEHSGLLVARGEINRLLQWIGRLPPQWRHRHPQLILNHAWSQMFRYSDREVEETLAHMPEDVATAPPYAAYLLLLRGSLAARELKTERAIALAEKAEAQLNQLPDSEQNRIMRGANALTLADAYRWRGDVQSAEAQYEAAITLNQDLQNLLILMTAIRGKGNLAVQRARLRDAEAIFQKGLDAERRWASQLGTPERKLLTAAPLHVSLGKLYYEWNRLDEAEVHLVDAVELLALSGPINRSEGLLALVRLQLAQDQAGDVSALLRELDLVREQARGTHARRRVIAALAAARCALYQHQPSAEIEAALGQSLSELAREPADVTSHAQLLLALERPDAALSLLDEALPGLAESKRPGRWLPAAILRCVAHQQVGDLPVALRRLEEILSVAGPAGYIRLFVDAGRSMAKLLDLSAREEPGAPLAAALLSRFPDNSIPQIPPENVVATTLPDNPLSPRETEVLQLIARGLTNREIAVELVIAPSTAKRHTVNIYNKLGVGNRAEATARAYEIGLID